MKRNNTMGENTDDIMVPGSTALREVHREFYSGWPETLDESFADFGLLQTVTPDEEPIDDDPSINALLDAENL